MGYNKVVCGKKVLIDLSNDTVSSDTLLFNHTAHDRSGTKITGNLFKNYPNNVTIQKSNNIPEENGTSGINKVTYGGKLLIDVTGDTVDQNSLLYGYKCHAKDGATISGKLLRNYPATVEFEDGLQDSSGNFILDSSEKVIQSKIVYAKSDETTLGRLTYTKK